MSCPVMTTCIFRLRIPRPEVYFYGFYDQFLNELLADSQTVFPGLSMEVRLDVDPVDHKDGSQEGFMHSLHLPQRQRCLYQRNVRHSHGLYE